MARKSCSFIPSLFIYFLCNNKLLRLNFLDRACVKDISRSVRSVYLHEDLSDLERQSSDTDLFIISRQSNCPRVDFVPNCRAVFTTIHASLVGLAIMKLPMHQRQGSQIEVKTQ